MTLLDPTGKKLPPRLHVAIAVPSNDHVAASFAFDLARLVGYSTLALTHVKLSLFTMKSTLLPDGRNGLVKEARRSGATHILWLDSDMRFPKNTLERLLAHGKDIVGANYTTRRFPHVPTAEIGGQGLVYIQPGAEGLVQVTRMGMGVMLTSMKPFDAMEQPYFALAWSPAIESFSGEDIFFCRQAAAKGFPSFVDAGLSLEVAHCGEMEYRNEHALAVREAMNADVAEGSDGPGDGDGAGELD